MRAAEAHARAADACLVLGSSCRVTPAADLPEAVGLREMLDRGVVDLATHRERALHWAASNGQARIMVLLVVNTAGDADRGVLHDAALRRIAMLHRCTPAVEALGRIGT